MENCPRVKAASTCQLESDVNGTWSSSSRGSTLQLHTQQGAGAMAEGFSSRIFEESTAKATSTFSHIRARDASEYTVTETRILQQFHAKAYTSKMRLKREMR